MARIKVTGYIETTDLDPEDVDLGHPMGVSDEFYENVTSGARSLPELDEIEFELEQS